MKSRTEEEMYDLIMSFAHKDDLIRAALLNGSRVNPNATKDIFMDYDLIYLVTDVEPFKDEKYVLAQFGEIMLLQKPEDKIFPPPFGDGRYVYLVQFIDGNRIDMQFINVKKVGELLNDSLTKVLIDKDKILPPLPAPSEQSYLIKKPSQKQYDDCCNEFLWGLGSHIPKTIWRGELPLVMQLIEVVLRNPLIEMFKWYIGVKTNYQVTIGRGGRYLQKYLEPELWDTFKQTYSDANFDNIWNSLCVFHNLFERIATVVANKYQYRYPKDESKRAIEFLKHVAGLPKEVKSIF